MTEDKKYTNNKIKIKKLNTLKKTLGIKTLYRKEDSKNEGLPEDSHGPLCGSHVEPWKSPIHHGSTTK